MIKEILEKIVDKEEGDIKEVIELSKKDREFLKEQNDKAHELARECAEVMDRIDKKRKEMFEEIWGYLNKKYPETEKHEAIISDSGKRIYIYED